tara:strand:- start:321 stop:926 length:606 start_codon:yes stop_codon:yes gene_type:complete
MASKFNSEFNYRYQVIGHTPWEKIKTLQGFLEGRLRSATGEESSKIRRQGEIAKLKWLEETNAPEHEILFYKAAMIDSKSNDATSADAFNKNREEIKILEKLLEELYIIAEPTRIPGYTDEEMWEVNQANEFTVTIGRQIQAEMIANGRPSPAKIGNAMSNPHTWNALKGIGLIPEEVKILEGNIDPKEKVKLIGVDDESI